MKIDQILCLVCAALLALPLVSNAAIYKWKDKNGVTRYSDMPPVGNANAKVMGKEKPKVTINTDVPEEVTQETAKVPPVKKQLTIPEDIADPEEEAARLRQRNAEIEKKNKIEADRQAKIDLENCSAAKANYQQFSQGGRIYKTNERGQREYYGEDELSAGKQKAQNEINKYCK